MTLRRASTTAAFVAAAMVLAACGRSSSAGTATSTTSAGGSAPSTAGAAAVTGTVTLWAQGTEGQDLPLVVKGFETANPGVKVNVTAIPWGDAHAKYQTAIAGGTTPDVAQMGTTWMADFASAFAPVPTTLDTSDIFAGAKSSTVVKGATVGLPWYVDTRVIYYRTDLAAKAGYTSPPTTWADFKAMTKAMQTKAGAKWGINLLPGGTDSFQSALPFVWSDGASLMNSDGSKWTLNTPQVVDAMKYYQSFFADGIADPNLSREVGAAESAFVKGTTPVLISSPAEVSSINQAGGPGFTSKYAVMAFPKKASATSFVGGSDLVVFGKSKNTAAAWKLVQYLSDPAIQASWYKATGDLPAVQSAWADPSLAGDPHLSVFKAQMGDVKSPPANTGWTQVSAAADSQLERIVQGTDPAKALQTLQGAADSIGIGN